MKTSEDRLRTLHRQFSRVRLWRGPGGYTIRCVSDLPGCGCRFVLAAWAPDAYQVIDIAWGHVT